MIKGVIFDMDGVLVDTEPFYHSQRMEFLRRMDYVPASTVHLIGSNEPEIWEAIAPQNPQMREDLLRGYHAFRRLHPTPYRELLNHEAIRILDQLQWLGLKRGLASSSVRESIELMLKQTGLGPRFDCFVSGEDCAAYKPDPEIYQRTLNALGLKPEDVIAVEDSPAGIASAKRAGIRVFALYSKGQDQSGADRVIETLGELLEWL